jgi:phenylacetate-CoA ligase
MGTWIGGLITYKCIDLVARRHKLPISIITPGIHKGEIFEALSHLPSHYKQVVLTGYPPFIKDVLDEAPGHGVDLASLHTRVIFAAETFTERFRDYIATAAGIKDVCRDTMNIYGSAELGVMAFETPLTIHARRRDGTGHQLLHRVLGRDDKLPTLAQYDPGHICFEEQDQRILITGDNALPLIRYEIGDSGGVFDFEAFVERYHDLGVDLLGEMPESNPPRPPLPLVYVYERADFATKLYGLFVFPAHVREALEHPSVVKAITGKFTLVTKTNEKLDQFLEINIELRPHTVAPPELANSLRELIVHALVSHNAEYSALHSVTPNRTIPQLVFWPYEHPEYFKPGVKQKWVKECRRSNGQGAAC